MRFGELLKAVERHGYKIIYTVLFAASPGWPQAFDSKWSGRGDLNARPPAPKAGALPGCATPRLSMPFILNYFRIRCNSM